MLRKSLQKIASKCPETIVLGLDELGTKMLCWRGTRGNGEFSNPHSLKEKGGFLGRGTSPDIAYHRFVANDTLYIPTSDHETVACKFVGFYGWVHVMQRPAIYVNVAKIHQVLPKPICMTDSDERIDSAISSEGEYAAVGSLPWSDVILSRKMIGVPSMPFFHVYLEEAVYNKDFKPRNFSCEILSADPEQTERLTPALDLCACKRPMILDEAKQICEVLTSEASRYKLSINSEEFIVNAVMKDEPFVKSLESIAEHYHTLMSAKNDKRYLFFTASSSSPKNVEAEAEIVWKNVLKIK